MPTSPRLRRDESDTSRGRSAPWHAVGTPYRRPRDSGRRGRMLARLLRAGHTLDQTGEQDGHECNQPEPPICKCGKMKRMCLGSNADKHGREGRREQRRERFQCSMREWFKLWTEQRVAAKPESAEAKAQQKGDGITHGLTGWPSGPEYGPGWCRSSRQGGRLRYRSALSCVRQMPPDPSNRRRGRRPS